MIQIILIILISSTLIYTLKKYPNIYFEDVEEYWLVDDNGKAIKKL